MNIFGNQVIRLVRNISLAMVLLVSTAALSEDRHFLKANDGYSDVQRLQIDLICLRIQMQENERIEEFQFHQMAQEIARALSATKPQDRQRIDLTGLDVFNYSIGEISLDETNQQIVVSVLANQKYVEQKEAPMQKRFLSDTFRLISQSLAKNFVDYDEYRDLTVLFYPLEFSGQPFVQYREGGYTWGSSQR